MLSTYIVWDEHKNLVIRDETSKMHARVRNFMLEEHFKPNLLYNTLRMQEEKGVNEDYMVFLNHVLRNEVSIVAMNEKDNSIHAVALLKWMTEEWRSWVHLLQILDSPKINHVLLLWRIMILNYSKEFPKHDFDSLHIFVYYISEELREDPIFLYKFFNAICEVGRHMKMPRVTYVALSKREQQLMEDCEFTELSRTIYALYETPQHLRPLAMLRDEDEQMAILYEKKLEPLIPWYEMGPRKTEVVEPEEEKPEPEMVEVEVKRRSSE